ncbi:MAG: hypothetical protein AB1414_18475 [bacterium]
MIKRIFLGLMIVVGCILIFGTYRLSDGKEKNIVSKPSRPQHIKVNLQYTGELRLGKVISLSAEVMPDLDVSKMEVGFGYYRNDDFEGGGIRYLGPTKFELGQVKKDEKHKFNVDLIIEKEGTYLISVSAWSPVPGKENIPTIVYDGSANIPKFCLDDKGFEWYKDRIERERQERLLHPQEWDMKEENGNWFYFKDGKWISTGKNYPYEAAEKDGRHESVVKSDREPESRPGPYVREEDQKKEPSLVPPGVGPSELPKLPTINLPEPIMPTSPIRQTIEKKKDLKDLSYEDAESLGISGIKAIKLAPARNYEKKLDENEDGEK